MHPTLITAPDAAKLPRWVLALLCVLYVVPGLIGRGPWTTDDAVGFGAALTMAQGSAADWLRPNVAGVPLFDDGPLAYWIGAAFMRALPLLDANLAMRLATAGWLAGALAATWYALYLLARRPEVQPDDPFGASPSRTDFGRAVADAGLLLLLATFGLIARVHETTIESLQVTLTAAFLFGAAHALRAPRQGGLIAGLAVGATVMTRGLPPAAALLAAGFVLPWAVQQYRLVARPYLLALLAGALAAGGLWPLMLALSGPEGVAHLGHWLQWNLRSMHGPGHAAALAFFGKTLPWFFWPAWPVAAWALYAWRRRLSEPAVALPLATLACCALVAAGGTQTSQSPLMPMAPALAMLAGVGLPTLQRRALSLIDWFSVAAFSVFGFALWAYWFAWMTGTPPRMATSIVRLAPGLSPRVSIPSLAFAMAVSVAWLGLVRWRLARRPRALWRAVVLSSAGFVLAWSLLTSLWMPIFDYRRSHRYVAQGLATIVPPDHRCVAAGTLGPASRAGFAYYASLRLARTPGQAAGCEWLLVDVRAAGATMPPPERWRRVWDGRRATDRTERYRLYRRIE